MNRYGGAPLRHRMYADIELDQAESELSEIKSQVKLVLRRLSRNSEPQASIESGQYTLQYVPDIFLWWWKLEGEEHKKD